MTTIILILAGCASEEYVGDVRLHEANENGRPVSFDLVAAPQTRAVNGASAAELLNNNFVVWGDKTMSDNSRQTVFDNYVVNFTTNSANTTTTNSAGWEYVGSMHIPYGTRLAPNVPLNDEGVIYNSASQTEGVWQSVKYWDYSAAKYTFFAYSLGKGYPKEKTVETDNGSVTVTTPLYAKASGINKDEDNGYAVDYDRGCFLTGSVEELAACYISDKVTRLNAEMSATNSQVSFSFRRLGAKVRIALYETIPGFSVKDVRFYQSSSDKSPDDGIKACLYAASGTKFYRGDLDDGKFVNINFDANGAPVLGWPNDNSTDQSYIYFGNADPTGSDWENWAEEEYLQEEGDIYIGRSSTDATGPKDFKSVIPYPNGTDLTLKVDYTLLSRDDTAEEIHVKGATAIVPAQFTAWKSNCAYTYLFKITDNDLHPITLDAVYINSEGQQETITTVTEPSITTYQQGADHLTAGGEYVTDKPIYIVVYDGTEVANLSQTGTVVSLYTATIEEGATMTITEATVAKAITSGAQDPTGTWTLTEGGKNMVVTAVGTGESVTDKLQAFTDKVPAEAAPDNSDITFGTDKVAWFTPDVESGEKYYVFRYQRPAVVEAYNVVEDVTVGTTVVTGYYERTGEPGSYTYTKVTTVGQKAEDGKTYCSYIPAKDAADQYKVIKVKAAPAP